MNPEEKNKNYLKLRKLSLDAGIDLFGIADIKNIKKDFFIHKEVLKKVENAICLGVRLSAAILEEIEHAPTRIYSYHYRTVNTFLDQVALQLTNYIQRQGYSAFPIPASQVLDWQSHKAHLSHREIAALAGLGWIGRNNLLVNEELGSQLRLVTVLTNMPLKVDKPLKKDCGLCRMCIIACPAGAIKEKKEDFDSQKCFAKIQDFTKKRLVEQYVCGVCVNICKGK